MERTADLVLTGGHVHTVDPALPRAEAVAVAGERIVAVGSAADVAAWIGPRTRVVDLAGRLLLPGFQDAHVHPTTGGMDLLECDVREHLGRRQTLAAIAAYAAAHPEKAWIIGSGWYMGDFENGTPRREDLDAIVADRPAFLPNRDGHSSWVNSRALELAGIDAGTPDPPDGRIERDPDGAPTGMLHEGAAYSFNERWVPEPTREQWEQAILTAQQHLYALGVTGWQDAWVTPQTFEAYRSLGADGRLTAQVVGALWWDRHRGLDQIAEFCERREHAAGRFRPTTVKIMVDGIIENQTASLLEPYCAGCGAHESRGLDYVDRELLTAALTELDGLGFQVHMHAIGDRAIRNALDAVEAAQAANGPSDRRHHIAHVQVIQPEDLPRFAALGVVANCQTYWAQSEPQMDELTIPYIGTERGALQYPFEGLGARGARLAMGSDWPVTTADPLQQLEVAVRRIDPEHRDNAPFLPEQALSLDDALTAFTAGSAYTNHDPD